MAFVRVEHLLLENLALRQQLAVLKRKRTRPKLNALDKLFWVLACRFWTDWKRSLLVVTPETVVRWHRAGFQLYWSWISRAKTQVGRKKLAKEGRELIFRMVAENPTWGAPRIHGELLMLGFAVSERTVSRWMQRTPRDPEPVKGWRSFLENHKEAIAAVDFFSVPTIAFAVLHCFFVIRHDRRRILHFNVTRHPTSGWIVQQLREPFPFGAAPRFLIHDWDAKYGAEVPAAIRSGHKSSSRFLPQSVAEWSCRAMGRELPPRAAGPCDCSQRAAPEAAPFRVHFLPSGRSHAPWTGQGNATAQDSLPSLGSRASHDRLGGLRHRYDRAA